MGFADECPRGQFVSISHLILLVSSSRGHHSIPYFVGSVDYCITEESLKDRLNINMHEACQQIDKECR
jgi:hypothetical protein